MAAASQGELRQTLEKIIEPFLERHGFELVLLQLAGSFSHPTVRVFIDRQEGGVSIADCVAVNRDLSALLDVEDPLPGRYTLEVSSPGVERPLCKASHFERFAGQQARLAWQDSDGTRRKATGWLRGMLGAAILFEVEGTTHQIPLAQLAKAQLKYDFSGKSAPRKPK